MLKLLYYKIFFFTSRRRHTRWPRDWSSDVCSSDLGSTGKPKGVLHTTGGYLLQTTMTAKYVFDLKESDTYWCTRSEERRVGKEYSSEWVEEQIENKKRKEGDTYISQDVDSME